MLRMKTSKFTAIVSIISIVLSWNRILVAAFNSSPVRFHKLPSRSSSRNFICIHDAINDDNNDHGIADKGSAWGYSILLADNREKALAIKLYRFGGQSVDEYMESKPDLVSREDALRFLTPTFDDKGAQKVFYKDGVFGESVQFFAQVDDVSAFISTLDDENSKLSLTKTQGVLGSVEAVEEYTREGNDANQISIELKNLSVLASARRRGIGKALTEAVQEYARHQVSVLEKQESQRCTGIVHLTVESDNKGAMKLYEETGFVCPANSKVEDDELCNLRWTTSKDNNKNVI